MITMPEFNFGNVIAVAVIGYGIVLVSDLLKQALSILSCDQKHHFRFDNDAYNRFHRK